MDIPAITTKQMAEVDRLMIEVFHIELVQMMENAGRNLADLGQTLIAEAANPKILILCGSGNNGGGGLVAARHLINRGFQVEVVLINDQKSLKEIPKHQWSILEIMGVETLSNLSLAEFNIIIDAMIGYGLTGNPRGNAAEWIRKINTGKIPILSLDVPSGLDATLGSPLDPCTRANATLTLALPKTGLMTAEARSYVGDLYLADISVPQQLYKMMKIDTPPDFLRSPIIKIL